MTVESGSTFFTGTWNFLHALISGNVADPQTRNKKWIFGGFPDVEGPNFPGYPIVTIDNPKASVSQASWTTNSIMENKLDTTITIYAKTSTELNTINNQVYSIVKDSEPAFTGSGINLEGITPGADGVDVIGNQRIHWNEHVVSHKRMTH
jgi:hypothetical protein